MRRSLAISLAVLVVSAGTGFFVVPPNATAGGEPPSVVAIDGFLGFEVGEERRYVIGPDTAMRPGEEVTWSVRLDRLETGAGGPIGVFELLHKSARYGVSLAGGINVVWNYSGELRVNEHGFPEQISWSMFEEHTGEAPWRGELMSADYVFNGASFTKDVMVPNQQWQFPVPIASFDAVDLEVPTGLFLFQPRAQGANFFTSPALLGFAIPEELPDGWQQRTMFFRPTDPVRHPGAGYAQFERNRREALGRYWVKRTLTLGEETEIEIGGRTMAVRKVRISGPTRDAYIDAAGRVVRIDLDPDAYTRNNRYIRLLYPSEY